MDKKTQCLEEVNKKERNCRLEGVQTDYSWTSHEAWVKSKQWTKKVKEWENHIDQRKKELEPGVIRENLRRPSWHSGKSDGPKWHKSTGSPQR